MRISDWSSDVCSSDLCRDHDIELARLRVGQQLLNGGAQDHARPRDGGVGIAVRDHPSFAFGALLAEALLVGDRRGILLVGRIAGIERGADHGWFPCDHGLKRRMPVASKSATLRVTSVNWCRFAVAAMKASIAPRSEERRVGKEGVSTCRSRG